MYNIVSMNIMNITQPMLKLSMMDSGRAKLSNDNPSRRTSRVERTVTPKPTHVLERKHVPIFVPLRINNNNN